MKIPKTQIRLDEGLRELEFNQFLQVANFFGISLVDKTESSPIAEDGSVDTSKVKMRRDFDFIANEIIDAYRNLPRHTRRSIDRIFSKIIRANRSARKIINEGQTEKYEKAKELAPTVAELIAKGETNG